MTKGKSVKNDVAEMLFARMRSVFDANVVANVTHLKKYTDLLEDVVIYYKNNDVGNLKHKEDPVVEYMMSVQDKDDLYKEYQPWLGKLIKYINSLTSETEGESDCVYKINIGGFIDAVHKRNSKSVIIVLGETNMLRNYSLPFGELTMFTRKQFGEVDHPPVLFMFDEADVFISSKNVGEEEDDTAIKNSKRIAKSIARRGRKYGVGLGIATQRVKNLDTDIMTQPNTYFVGKLIREGDRQTVAEGFGIDTYCLDPDGIGLGEWIVISHGALGQKSVPMPIRFENADERLINFITDEKMATGEVVGIVMKEVGIYSDMEEKSSAFIADITDNDYIPSIIM
jgi:hypothetical protein